MQNRVDILQTQYVTCDLNNDDDGDDDDDDDDVHRF